MTRKLRIRRNYFDAARRAFLDVRNGIERHAFERAVQSWHAGGALPGIDRKRADEHAINYGSSSISAAPDKKGSLLVHVAFHFVEMRIPFVVETVRALAELPFEHIRIIIDTNSADTNAALSPYLEDIPVSYAIWTELEDPFRLTWMHRRGIAAEADAFDAYMYVEDDIVIRPAAIGYWREALRTLNSTGHIPGFLRVEENRRGELVLSDFRMALQDPHTLNIGGMEFLDTPYPYQAFWLLTRSQLTEFISSDSWDNGARYPQELESRYGALDTREQAAAGLTFENIPDGFFSRALVPLRSGKRLHGDAFVFHSPSNYGRRLHPHPSGFGTVSVENAVLDC